MDEKNTKTEEVKQQVEEGLQALTEEFAQGKSANFVAILDAISRFHRYSWGNTFLITLQSPDATIIAGFSTWKGMGRYVKAGEKGIAILAPIPKRVRVEADEEAEGQSETKSAGRTIEGSGVWGFKVVYVFDVSQTEGKPLPEIGNYQGDPEEALVLIRQQITAAGIQLEYVEDQENLGLSYGGLISIRSGLSSAEEFHALAHELGHEWLHPKEERRQFSKTVRETEAEAVAYVVSRAIGLDPGTSASDYIQLYQGDAETLAASLERIQQTATRILTGLKPPKPQPRARPDAAPQPM